MAAPGKACVKRRLAAIVAAGVLLLSHGLLSLAAYAQQADKLPRVGVLTNSPLTSAHYEAFRHALRDLGYVEGKNITFIPKSAQGNADLFPELARELARANVNVMLVAGDQGLRAAKEATGTIQYQSWWWRAICLTVLSSALHRPAVRRPASPDF